MCRARRGATLSRTLALEVSQLMCVLLRSKNGAPKPAFRLGAERAFKLGVALHSAAAKLLTCTPPHQVTVTTPQGVHTWSPHKQTYHSRSNMG